MTHPADWSCCQGCTTIQRDERVGQHVTAQQSLGRWRSRLGPYALRWFERILGAESDLIDAWKGLIGAAAGCTATERERLVHSLAACTLVSHLTPPTHVAHQRLHLTLTSLTLQPHRCCSFAPHCTAPHCTAPALARVCWCSFACSRLSPVLVEPPTLRPSLPPCRPWSSSALMRAL